MLDKLTARALVTTAINPRTAGGGKTSDWVVLDQHTIEKPYGWVFFWTSRLWLETREILNMPVGNGPILVNRFDGSLHWFGTAWPVEHYIAEYERESERARSKWGLLFHADPNDIEVLRRILKALFLSMDYAAELKRKLPGILKRGARVDLEPTAAALLMQGISAEVVLTENVDNV